MTRSGSRPACSTQSAYKLRGLYRRDGGGAVDGVPKAVRVLEIDDELTIGAIEDVFTPATSAADVIPDVSLAPAAKAATPLNSAAAAGCSLALRSSSPSTTKERRFGEGPGDDIPALAAAAEQCCCSRLAGPHGPPGPASTARASARVSRRLPGRARSPRAGAAPRTPPGRRLCRRRIRRRRRPAGLSFTF